MANLKEVIDTTTNSTVYKKAVWKDLCPFESLKVVRYFFRSIKKQDRSWKRYRKTQYKNKDVV